MLHWRYYYDPPEFLTVIKGDDEKQFHIGYFRYVEFNIHYLCSVFFVIFCCVVTLGIKVFSNIYNTLVLAVLESLLLFLFPIPCSPITSRLLENKTIIFLEPAFL